MIGKFSSTGGTGALDLWPWGDSILGLSLFEWQPMAMLVATSNRGAGSIAARIELESLLGVTNSITALGEGTKGWDIRTPSSATMKGPDCAGD